MVKSIIQTDNTRCFVCGRNGPLERHHCLHGTANRRLAEEDGLFVWLCPYCHRISPQAVHNNREHDLMLIRVAQRRWEEVYQHNSHEDFIKRYGKNYLED